MRCGSFVLLLASALALAATSAPAARWVHFSVTVDGTLDGVSVQDGDVFTVTPDSPEGSRIHGPRVSESIFVGNEDIDSYAACRGISGSLLTTVDAATFDDGLSLAVGQIARWNPRAAPGSRATLYYDTDAIFVDTEAVDAIAMLPNGNLLISTRDDGTVDNDSGDFAFEDEDILLVDTSISWVEMYLEGDTVFDADEDIDALAVFANGHLLLSTAADASINGTFFGPGDVVRYIIATDSESIYIAAGEFNAEDPINIDALEVIVPEPAAFALVGLAVAVAAGLRRRPAR